MKKIILGMAVSMSALSAFGSTRAEIIYQARQGIVNIESPAIRAVVSSGEKVVVIDSISSNLTGNVDRFYDVYIKKENLQAFAARLCSQAGLKYHSSSSYGVGFSSLGPSYQIPVFNSDLSVTVYLADEIRNMDISSLQSVKCLKYEASTPSKPAAVQLKR